MSRFSEIGQWIEGHRRLVLALLLILGALLRVAVFLQNDAGPGAVQHRWVESDMHYFDGWARSILAGDRLSREVEPPQHQWHHAVASDYLRRTGGGDATNSAEEERRLWGRWCGGGQFYQEPLYPYLLSLTYATLGADPRWVLCWQLMLGLLGGLLLCKICSRCFGLNAGLLATALFVLSGPVLFYEIVLLRAATIGFIGLLLVDLTQRAMRGNAVRAWGLVGLVLGLAMSLKGIFAIYLLGSLLLPFFGPHGRSKASLRLAATILLGASIGLAPLVVRNLLVGVPPLQFTSAGGVNFILANSDAAARSPQFFSTQQVAPILERTAGRLLPSILATFETHSGPFSYVKLLWAKFTAVWHWYEIPGNANFYYYRLQSSVLKHLPVTHALLAPLALVGLVLAARSRFRSISAPLYLLVLTHLAALLGFFVYARHRVPLQLALMPFAAFAVVQTVVWIRERRRSAALTLLVALLFIGGWTLRPLPAQRPTVRAADYLAPHKIYYTPRFNAAAAAGDWERVVTLIEDVLRLEPDWIGAGSPVTFDRFTMTRLYGNLRLNRARALERIGRKEEALAEYERARELRTIGDEIEAQLRLSPRVGD